jgi:hypothetical protein
VRERLIQRVASPLHSCATDVHESRRTSFGRSERTDYWPQNVAEPEIADRRVGRRGDVCCVDDDLDAIQCPDEPSVLLLVLRHSARDGFAMIGGHVARDAACGHGDAWTDLGTCSPEMCRPTEPLAPATVTVIGSLAVVAEHGPAASVRAFARVGRRHLRGLRRDRPGVRRRVADRTLSGCHVDAPRLPLYRHP